MITHDPLGFQNRVVPSRKWITGDRFRFESEEFRAMDGSCPMSEESRVMSGSCPMCGGVTGEHVMVHTVMPIPVNYDAGDWLARGVVRSSTGESIISAPLSARLDALAAAAGPRSAESDRAALVAERDRAELIAELREAVTILHEAATAPTRGAALDLLAEIRARVLEILDALR